MKFLKNIIFTLITTMLVTCATTKNVVAMQRETSFQQDFDWAKTKESIKAFFEKAVLPKLKTLNEFAETKEKIYLPKFKEKAIESTEKLIRWLSNDTSIKIAPSEFKTISIALGCFTGLVFPSAIKLGLFYILATRAWPLIMIAQKNWWTLACSRSKIKVISFWHKLTQRKLS